MQCWQREQPAEGVYRFCGRMAGTDHTAKVPSIPTIYVDKRLMPEAVVVANATCCSTCQPQPEPIDMAVVYQAAACHI
jgi:hypothetical protein